MAVEVFNRKEKKYMLHRDDYHRLTTLLKTRLVPDGNNQDNKFYTICNLYFDTDDNYYIRTSLEKPRYKEKLRLRGYGIPGADDKVYMEIKKKVSGAVNKRRSPMTLCEAYRFLEQGIVPENGNSQVLKEIDYILQTRHLSPKLYLAYDRTAYFCADDADLRVTFDSNIRTRRYDLLLEAGDYGYPLLKKDYVLMEIKSQKAVPVWFSEMLSALEISPVSFSKYGAEYLRMLDEAEDNREGSTGCLRPFLKAVLEPISPQQPHYLVS